MLLAITATDVAFVSVIVAGVTTIVGPLVTWQIAKGGWKHERDVDISRRNYEARRDVYVELLRWERLCFKDLDAHQNGTASPVTIPEDEAVALFARVSTFGSREVVAKMDEFGEGYERVWAELDEAEKSSADDHQAVDWQWLVDVSDELDELVRNELTR